MIYWQIPHHNYAVRSACLLWGQSLEGSAFNIIAYSPTSGMPVTLDEQVEWCKCLNPWYRHCVIHPLLRFCSTTIERLGIEHFGNFSWCLPKWSTKHMLRAFPYPKICFLHPNVLKYPLLAMETSGFGSAILSLFNCFAVKVLHPCWAASCNLHPLYALLSIKS